MPNANQKVLADTARLEALRRTLLMDSEVEAAFDRLTNLARRIIDTPVSMVSLVDDQRQFFKSAAGFDFRETPVQGSFCQHVVETGEPLIINDARSHPLVSDSPYIAQHNFVGYLGLPLSTSDGHHIGSLCVIDSKPHEWTQNEIEILREISNSVMMEIELRVKIEIEKEEQRKISDSEIYGRLDKQATKEFGVYKVLEEIGSGGMARVYRAEHKLLCTQVAIKEMLPEKFDDDAFLERFKREAEIVANLKHPNIVRVFDFGLEQEYAYMVMEYIHGESLAELMQRDGPLTLEQTLTILDDVSNALMYAHKSQIIHRDIKPANIMLRRRVEDGEMTDDYHATLTDFGIAKMHGNTSQLTGDYLLGTLDFMSPEQLMSDKNIDCRADVYSLGVMAYYMLTNQFPIKASNPTNMIIAHLQHRPVSANKVADHIPQHISDALDQALAKKPDHRPQSPLDFLELLQPISASNNLKFV